MPTVKKLQGYDGRVTINSVAFCVTKYDVTATVNSEVTTDTCSNGYVTRTTGLKDCKGSFTLTYDGSNPPVVEEGDELVNLVFAHKVGSGTVPAFSIASGWVTSRALHNPIPGLVSYDVDFEGNGAYHWGALPTP